jgi:glycerol-3-phosphate dehydrogenase (NAD(P)+)
MRRVAVMGAGSWGTAFGMVLSDAGQEAVMWAREPEVQESINTTHTNDLFHPGVRLPEQMRATGDPAEALDGADLVILAIPAQTLASNLTAWREHMGRDSVVVSLMKGIELGTMRRMSQIISEDGGIPADRVAVVSGPNLAREIAQRSPAATTVACPNEASAKRLQEACTTGYFRPYWTTDVVGAEIGGSVKNVIALANGMAVGLGYGANAQASLITRGLAEMSRLGVALGANQMTFLGLAGMGDLIATCSSPLSRNRTFGEHLGQGLSVDETIAVTTQTCEGVKSCQPILELARSHGVEMPITEQVVAVVHKGMSPSDMLDNLMSRDTKPEVGAG